ncbi:MAG: tetratricopeptide repeat protein [Gammaproteobacteria bacterium]
MKKCSLSHQNTSIHTLLCGLLIGTLSLGGCSTAPPSGSTAAQSDVQTTETPTSAESSAAPQAKAPELSAETLFDLIIAEMAGKQNRLDVTLGNYIKQAHRTNDPEIIARAARIAKYMNAHQATLDATRLWLKKDPNNIEALQTITIQLIRASRFEEALQYMDKLIAQNASANLDFLIHHSRQITRRRRQRIIDTLDQLLEKYPRDPQLWFSKALLEEQNHNTKAALSATNMCLTFDPQYVSAIVFKAQLLTEQHKATEAERLLRRAVKKHPDHKRAGIIYAKTLVEQGKTKQAHRQFKRLVDTFPNDYDLLLSLALISWENHQTDQAKAYLTQLIEQDKRRDEAHTYLAQIAEAEHDTKKALEHFRHVEMGPDYFNAQINIARLLASDNHMEQARKTLADARSLQPQQAVQYYIGEAELLIEQGAPEDAETVYDTALAAHPADPNLLYSRAMFYVDNDNLAAMEADLRAIIADNPNSALALNALGYTLADRTDRLDEALELISKANALDPDDAAILDSLGWVHFRLGKLPVALQYLQRAYSEVQDHEIAAHLGEALWVSGQKSEALRIWKKALETNPDSEKIRETMGRLTPL